MRKTFAFVESPLMVNPVPPSSMLEAAIAFTGSF